MRVMAIDYGDARTGIAVSDLSRTLAGEAFTIQGWNPEAVAEAIAGEVRTRQVDTLVLGFPKNMDGTLNARTEKSQAFARLLEEKTGLPVVLWDERRTTVDAHRILSEHNRRGKKRKAVVDAVAATLILEGYLNQF
ncbi:MAG: Holliday junction resolvase RuvX [Lentisphaeria bacterium]|nr:Holliday junction resolvase RuvX [Lentisphaeria bacterium]